MWTGTPPRLTQSIYNSAGAAERMSNIKLDNLAGDLTLLQSATDGLSLSIGEQFMPQARGLVQVGTSLTSAESTEYHNILQLLCETVPDLAGSIDLTTGSIQGGTDALRAQTEAWQKNAEAQTYQEACQNLMGEYSAVMVEAAESSLRLTEAEMALEAQQKRRGEAPPRQPPCSGSRR